MPIDPNAPVKTPEIRPHEFYIPDKIFAEFADVNIENE